MSDLSKFLLVAVISALLLSCKTTVPTNGTSTSTDRKLQSSLKGIWKISEVRYPGSDYIKVNSFQIADSKCLIGSTWQFIPNNNTGIMKMNNADCQAFTSSIVWNVSKEGIFGLKFIDSGVKSKKVTQGYLMRFTTQTPTSFQLVDQIEVGGQQKEITYQFEKVN